MVIGRSILVGKPVSLMLQQAHASVTMCHSRTRDLAGHCRRADVLVAAVGARSVASIVTPHRRGVGPMTITMPLRNTLLAYEERHSWRA